MLRNEMPIFDVCRPCSVEYDFIAKFETLNYDMEYLAQKFNFGVKFPNKDPTTNPDYMRLYYHGLKTQHLKVLKTLYRKDFEVRMTSKLRHNIVMMTPRKYFGTVTSLLMSH